MAVGNKSNEISIFDIFKEYIPSRGVIGFVENIFRTEMG